METLVTSCPSIGTVNREEGHRVIHINSAIAMTGRPSAWEGRDRLKAPVSGLGGISVELASQRQSPPWGVRGEKCFLWSPFPPLLVLPL